MASTLRITSTGCCHPTRIAVTPPKLTHAIEGAILDARHHLRAVRPLIARVAITNIILADAAVAAVVRTLKRLTAVSTVPARITEAVAHAATHAMERAVIWAEASFRCTVNASKTWVTEALRIAAGSMVRAIGHTLVRLVTRVTAEARGTEALTETAKTVVVAVVRAWLYSAARLALSVWIAVALASEAQTVACAVVRACLVSFAGGSHIIWVAYTVPVDAAPVTVAVILARWKLRGHQGVGEIALVAVVSHPPGFANAIRRHAGTMDTKYGARGARLQCRDVMIKDFVLVRASKHPEVSANHITTCFRALAGHKPIRLLLLGPCKRGQIQRPYLTHLKYRTSRHSAAHHIHLFAIAAKEGQVVTSGCWLVSGRAGLFLPNVCCRVENVNVTFRAGPLDATKHPDVRSLHNSGMARPRTGNVSGRAVLAGRSDRGPR